MCSIHKEHIRNSLQSLVALVGTYLMGVADCHFYEPCRFLIGFVKEDPPLIGKELLENSGDCQDITQRWQHATSHRLRNLRQPLSWRLLLLTNSSLKKERKRKKSASGFKGAVAFTSMRLEEMLIFFFLLERKYFAPYLMHHNQFLALDV